LANRTNRCLCRVSKKGSRKGIQAGRKGAGKRTLRWGIGVKDERKSQNLAESGGRWWLNRRRRGRNIKKIDKAGELRGVGTKQWSMPIKAGNAYLRGKATTGSQRGNSNKEGMRIYGDRRHMRGNVTLPSKTWKGVRAQMFEEDQEQEGT